MRYGPQSDCGVIEARQVVLNFNLLTVIHTCLAMGEQPKTTLIKDSFGHVAYSVDPEIYRNRAEDIIKKNNIPSCYINRDPVFLNNYYSFLKSRTVVFP